MGFRVLGCDVEVRFWGVMLKFVMDAGEDDVVGVMRLLHVALTGFLGVLGCDAEVRCGC